MKLRVWPRSLLLFTGAALVSAVLNHDHVCPNVWRRAWPCDSTGGSGWEVRCDLSSLRRGEERRVHFVGVTACGFTYESVPVQRRSDGRLEWRMDRRFHL